MFINPLLLLLTWATCFSITYCETCRFAVSPYLHISFALFWFFVIVASYFGLSPVLLILRTAFSKLPHTHVALWPVSRVLVAFSFGFLAVKQTAHIVIFESSNF